MPPCGRVVGIAQDPPLPAIHQGRIFKQYFPSYKTRVTAPLDVRAGWKSEGASHTGRPQSDHHHR